MAYDKPNTINMEQPLSEEKKRLLETALRHPDIFTPDFFTEQIVEIYPDHHCTMLSGSPFKRIRDGNSQPGDYRLFLRFLCQEGVYRLSDLREGKARCA